MFRLASFAALSLAGGTGLLAAQILPPSAAAARDRLNTSPRHGEWISVPAAGGDAVESWIVYPERSDAAPVVVVIHEIFGLTDWIRAVADQLAASGFIAVAPDLLSGKGPDGGRTDSVDRDGAVALIRGLDADEVRGRLEAVAGLGDRAPGGPRRVRGGRLLLGRADQLRVRGGRPGPRRGGRLLRHFPGQRGPWARSGAPVLGLYGGDDARVNATIPPAQDRMEELGKVFEVEIYEGAGHGFLRAQEDREGRNLTAASQAWPRTIRFFRSHLGS